MKISIKFKLIIAFVLLTTIPIVLLSTLNYRLTTQSYYDNLKQNSLQISDQINYSITHFSMIYAKSVELIAFDDSFKFARTNASQLANVNSTFRDYIQAFPMVRNIYIGYENQDFHIYPHVNLPSDYDPRVRPWYIGAKEAGSLYWTTPYADASDGNVVVSAAIPIYRGQELEGVLAIDLDISELGALANDVSIGENGYIVLLDKDNIPFTHPNPDLIGQPIPIPELNDFVKNNSSGEIEYTFNGVDRIAILTSIDELGWKILAIVDESEIHDAARSLMMSILFFSTLLIIIAISVGYLLSSLLTKNIRKISEVVHLISKGDFTQKVEVKSQDELGALAKDVNYMINSMSELIHSVNGASENVFQSSDNLVLLSERASHSAKEVASAGEEVAKGATKQALDSESSLKNTQLMTENIQNLTNNLFKMIELTKETASLNEENAQAVESLRNRNEKNNLANEKTETAVLNLEKQSLQIDNFVQIISTIADQTNLLALNASIEAARAGEHGRGFAVVAEEIRKLAEESSDAAEQIMNIVINIQKGSQSTVQIMEEVKLSSSEQNEAVKRVEHSFETIFKAIESMESIIDVLSKDIEILDKSKLEIFDSISNIASVSEEAAAASEEVSASIQEQSEIVENVSHAAEELKHLAKLLQEDIQKFKV